MSQLDALFIQANAAHKIYQDLSKSYAAIEPNPWLLLLPNAVRAKGFSAAILDCEAENLTHEESCKRIEEIDPKLCVFVSVGQQPSASTQNMQGATELAQTLKEYNSKYPTLFVGPHMSAIPEESLSYPGIDMVCQNEGVYTLIDLLNNDVKASPLIQGLGWWDNGKIRLNPIGGLVPESRLDQDLPGLAMDLVDYRKYRTANWHSYYSNDPYNFASIYTSLGCFAKCEFCMINIINRTQQGDNISAVDSNIMRHWSVDFILSELEKLANLGVRYIKWSDEMAVYKPKHFLNILQGIIDRGYKFNQWMYSRVNTIKESYLETMAKAGVSYVGIGIEAANQKVRNEATKGTFTDVNIRDVVKMVESYGIEVGANYIVGLEDDTHETMQETLDLAIELNTSLANIYGVQAYPGSPLHIIAKQEGRALPTTFSGYSQHSYDCLPLSNKNLTSAEILAFRDKAWTAYFSNTNFLNKIEGKFGSVARNHIETLTKIKLKRKILGD